MAYTRSNASPEVNPAGDGVDISAPRARQAYTGRRILLILLVSLAAVVLAFLAAYLVNPTDGASGKVGATNDPAVAESFNTPPPQPKNPG